MTNDEEPETRSPYMILSPLLKVSARRHLRDCIELYDRARSSNRLKLQQENFPLLQIPDRMSTGALLKDSICFEQSITIRGV